MSKNTSRNENAIRLTNASIGNSHAWCGGFPVAESRDMEADERLEPSSHRGTPTDADCFSTIP
jgi:hypothetical protein